MSNAKIAINQLWLIHEVVIDMFIKITIKIMENIY
jgi:hypothetical protein